MIEAVVSSLIPPYEYRATDLLSAEAGIRAAAGSAQIGKPIGMLLKSLPTLNNAVMKLTGQITHLFPSSDPKRSLLSWALEDAIDAYREAAQKQCSQSEMPINFLKALLDRASFLTEFDVHAVDEMGNGFRWEMLSESLTGWITLHSDKRIVFVERSTSAFERTAAKYMLIGQVLTVSAAQSIHKLEGK